jgi:hypothetical protein
MNKKLRKMKKEIERRGGVMHVAPGLSDDVAEEFFRAILECPHCARQMREADGTFVEGRGAARGH